MPFSTSATPFRCRPTRAGSATSLGPSYGDEREDGSRVGVNNDFTQRNTTFVTWNLMHTALQLHEAGGVPAHGNQRSEWEAGCRFDHPNPEHR